MVVHKIQCHRANRLCKVKLDVFSISLVLKDGCFTSCLIIAHQYSLEVAHLPFLALADSLYGPVPAQIVLSHRPTPFAVLSYCPLRVSHSWKTTGAMSAGCPFQVCPARMLFHTAASKHSIQLCILIPNQIYSYSSFTPYWCTANPFTTQENSLTLCNYKNNRQKKTDQIKLVLAFVSLLIELHTIFNRGKFVNWGCNSFNNLLSLC